MRKIAIGSTPVFLLMQCSNFLIFISAILSISNNIYLWILIENINSFIFTNFIISILLLFTSIFGCYFTKNAPTGVIIYQILLVILTIFSVIITFLVIFDKEALIEFLISKMEDSLETILKTRASLDQNLDVIRIGMFMYSCVLVNYINLFLFLANLEPVFS